jgi:hypothetical protein
MPESGPYGSVRGALSNERPYRDFCLICRLQVLNVFWCVTSLESYRIEAMLDLIEIQLIKARRMARRADCDFLVYLIQMAIIEAKARRISPDNSLESLLESPSFLDAPHEKHSRTPCLKVVH